MTNKEKVEQIFPPAFCIKEGNHYTIWDDGTNPIHKEYKSSSEAWADMWKWICGLNEKELKKIKDFYKVRRF